EDGARVGGVELRADERAALARLHMLELDDPPRLAVDLDVHAVLELVGGDNLGHRRGSVATTEESPARAGTPRRPRPGRRSDWQGWRCRPPGCRAARSRRRAAALPRRPPGR